MTKKFVNEGFVKFGTNVAFIRLTQNYGEFFEKLLDMLNIKGTCSIDLAYGGGLTQANICYDVDPQIFFKKLEVAISKDFKGTFDSEDIGTVINNLVIKYGWQDCRIECRDFFIEQSHDEYFIVRQKPGKNLEWKKISEAVKTVFESVRFLKRNA